MEHFAKAITYYLKPAEGTSREEFIKTFACSVLVEKSGMVSGDSAKVFELRKRLNSQATDIFVGRAPTNDVVLADPAVSKSHFRFISIPGKNYQLADMFSTKGTYLNGKKIDPSERHQLKDHDEISFGTEYQLVYYSPQGFYEMLIGLKDNESKDREQKHTAVNELALLLDSIDRETTDLTEDFLEEESFLNDIALSAEDDLASPDSGMFVGDDIELGLEARDDSAGASTKIESKEQESRTKLDNQGKDEKMLTEKEVVSRKDGAALTDTSKDEAVQATDETLTEPVATPSELEATGPFDDAMGEEQETEDEAVQGTDKTLTGPAATPPELEATQPLDYVMGEEQAAVYEAVQATDKTLTEPVAAPSELEVTEPLDDAMGEEQKTKDEAVKATDETLTEPVAAPPELEATGPFDDSMGEEQAAEVVPAIDNELFEDLSSDYELANEVEEQEGEGEKPNLNALADELGTLLNKRMEAIVDRLVEERMPAIAEPIILETIKKLLTSTE